MKPTVDVQSKYLFGLDLGQTNDFTAVIVVERLQNVYTEQVNTARDPHFSTGSDWATRRTFDPATYHVRYIERMRNLPYPVMVERVKHLILQPEIADRYMLVLDRSGVGRAVYDLFETTDLHSYGITITGGATDTPGRKAANVCKANLVATVQVLHQAANPDRLQYVRGLADLVLLRAEVADFRVKVSKAQTETYAAREGQHDDLILGLALALWFGETCGNPQKQASCHYG